MPESGPILVVATYVGFYNLKRRKPGAIFWITGKDAFSENWMEKAPPGATPTDGDIPVEAPREGRSFSEDAARPEKAGKPEEDLSPAKNIIEQQTKTMVPAVTGGTKEKKKPGPKPKNKG